MSRTTLRTHLSHKLVSWSHPNFRCLLKIVLKLRHPNSCLNVSWDYILAVLFTDFLEKGIFYISQLHKLAHWFVTKNTVTKGKCSLSNSEDLKKAEDLYGHFYAPKIEDRRSKLANNFWTVSARAFILHTSISCDKIFLLVLRYLSLWS